MVTIILRRTLIILIGLLAACTPPTPPPLPTPRQLTPTPRQTVAFIQPTAPPVTPTSSPTMLPTATPATAIITVWTGLPQTQTTALMEDIQNFRRQFPQYTVNLQHYENQETLLNQLKTGETGFDVALVSPALLGQLWAGSYLAPMSNFFSADFSNDFAGVTLQGATHDGQVWGLADTAGFHLLLFYNRDLVDTPPQTTADLQRLAEKLSQNNQTDNHRGLAVNSYDPLWLAPWLAPYGGWLTNDAGEPTLNTPAVEAALTLYLSWQGRLTGIAPVITYEEARSRFLHGDIAMMIDGEWAMADLARANKINWGVALLPSVGEANASQPAAPLVLARYWVVSQTATGDRALAAAAFTEYMTRPERQLAWTARFGLLPTRRSALNNAAIVNDAALRLSAAQMQAGRAVPPGPDPNALLDAMREPLRQVIDGELTPQQAVKLMQQNAETKGKK